MNRENMNTEWKRFVRAVKKNRCEICGKRNSKSLENRLQIHHKVPVRHGGSDELANLLLICPNCHTMEENRAYFIAHVLRELMVGIKKGIFAD